MLLLYFFLKIITYHLSAISFNKNSVTEGTNKFIAKKTSHFKVDLIFENFILLVKVPGRVPALGKLWVRGIELVVLYLMLKSVLNYFF